MVHLAIFAKYWEAGKVKTRLAARLGDDRARDVYRVFLRHLMDKLGEAGDTRTIVFTPSDREGEFRSEISASWQLAPQSDGDLGNRMQCFFQAYGSEPTQKNILIGSDTPDLPSSYIRKTAEMLESVPVVIGPSADGGYYLLACRGEMPAIFEGIPWSTPRVLELTLEKLSALNCRYKLLPEMKDVDEFQDLQRLIRLLRIHGAEPDLLSSIEELELELE